MNNLGDFDTNNFHKKIIVRIKFLLIILILVFIIIILRLFYLQIIKHNFFKEKAKLQLLRTIALAPHRGDIYDRNNQLLATSINSYSVFASPKQIKDPVKTAKILSVYLNEKEYEILKKLKSPGYFIWIKRKISSGLMNKIKKYKLPGIDFLTEKKRVYLYDNLASHVLGFVGIDNQGLGGVEYSQDKFLRGKEGKLIVEQDPFGHEIITGKRYVQQATDGDNLILTIDQFIQYITERELKKAVKSTYATSGCAIVENPKTGEILAMATYPDFNPNDYSKCNISVFTNKNTNEVYEPGSTFKLITVSSALEEKVITPQSVFFCPPKLKVGPKTIGEAHSQGAVNKTVIDIVTESINVGTAQIGLRMNKFKFYNHILKFGFGNQTGIELAGETPGIVRNAKGWGKVDHAIIPFGQGIAITPLQLIQAVSAIGNNGKILKPYIIKGRFRNDRKFFKETPKTEKGIAISKETANKMVSMMLNVVKRGTAKSIKIPGYSIGGKTGTAQVPNPNGIGYIPGRYIASFVGLFPLNNPKVSILVVINNPRTTIWGSTAAAPVFKEIAKEIIYYMNIPPDNQKELLKANNNTER